MFGGQLFADKAHRRSAAGGRVCRFEQLESRRPLAANLAAASLPAADLTVADLTANELPSMGLQEATASIAGRVTTTSGEHGAAEGVPNVTLYLLGEQGQRLQTTATTNTGEYAFTGLTPGLYAVQEVQPANLADVGMIVGSGGGQVITTNLLGEIHLTAGAQLSGYEFLESHDPAPSDDGPPMLERQAILSEVAGQANVFLQMPNAETTPIFPPSASSANERLAVGRNELVGAVGQQDVTTSGSAFDTSTAGGSSALKPVKRSSGLLPNGATWRSAFGSASEVVTDKLFETVDWQRAVIDQLLWLAPKTPRSEAAPVPAGEAQAEAPVEVASLPTRVATEVEAAEADADRAP